MIWSSIVLLFVELGFGHENSLSSSSLIIFLWIERIVATIFGVEYILRWVESCKTNKVWVYPTSVMGLVDVLAFLPFMCGFFVPPSMLGWIRSLRILRTFKLFRYDRHLQLFALAVWRSWWLLSAIGRITIVAVLFGSALMYQAEHTHQEEFKNIFNVVYFVLTSITTIGYGDLSPVTSLGKLINVIFIYIPGVAIFAAMVGIVGNAWSITMEEEKDPDYDPIAVYLKERTCKS